MNRADLKSWAKNALNRSYWKSVLVPLILGGATSAISYIISFSSSFGVNMLSALGTLSMEDISEDDIVGMGILMLSFIGVAMIFGLVGFLVQIFLINPLNVGCQRFFCVGLYQNKPELNEVGAGFKGNYKNTIKVLFFRDLFLSLWLWLVTIIGTVLGVAMIIGMVFVLEEAKLGEVAVVFVTVFVVLMVYVVIIACEIPYFIKCYEYMMIPYILADYPDMPRKQVFAMTKKMMKGEKWNAFVLNLSFIGWDLLSVCTCGILSIFYVEPYKYYTKAAFYKMLQQKLERTMQAEQVMMQQNMQQPNNY